MPQRNEDDETRALLLGRIRTALQRLDDSDTPDNATLARLAIIFEEAVSVLRFSSHHSAGHFLMLLREPERVPAIEAIAPRDPDLQNDEDARECAALSDQTVLQPLVNDEPDTSQDMRPPMAMEAASKAGCSQPPRSTAMRTPCLTHSQRAPLGTLDNPIGRITRSHPY